jgi:hypothetical protein
MLASWGVAFKPGGDCPLDRVVVKPTRGTLARAPPLGYHGPGTKPSCQPGPAIEEAAMLSRAHEARVLDVLRDCPSDAIRTYCLEHLTAAGKIPSAHAVDLIAFIQALQAKGDCEAQYGGFCDADGHDTEALLVWRPDSPVQGVR